MIRWAIDRDMSNIGDQWELEKRSCLMNFCHRLKNLWSWSSFVTEWKMIICLFLSIVFDWIDLGTNQNDWCQALSPIHFETNEMNEDFRSPFDDIWNDNQLWHWIHHTINSDACLHYTWKFFIWEIQIIWRKSIVTKYFASISFSE